MLENVKLRHTHNRCQSHVMTAVISIEDSSVRDLESVVLFNGRRTGEKDRKEEGKEIWHMVAP